MEMNNLKKYQVGGTRSNMELAMDVNLVWWSFRGRDLSIANQAARVGFGTAVGGLSGAFARRWRSRLRQAPSNRPDFTSERKLRTAWPPSAPQRWPQRFIRCCTRFLLLDSTVS